jgi:ABC-2 type transport system ATP-binding protein
MSRDATPTIEAVGLTRHFRVPVREGGMRAAMRSVTRRRYRTVRAVDGIDLSIAAGEVVGFLGPNGAGKTTTLKLLSGLVHPSGGSARVLGHEPARRDHDLLRRIALVMGNRQQLTWDIPATDSYLMLGMLYDVPRPVLEQRIAQLVDLLSLQEVVDKPVRQLSLGERMRCEIAASLLHQPEVLFLDEPTLGLDVGAQRIVREFVARYARETGATVLLTSHYMADIEALAERVLVIHHGLLQFEGTLRDLTERISDRKRITVRLDPVAGDPVAAVAHVGTTVGSDGNEAVVEVPRRDVRAAMAALLDVPGVLDFVVEDEPIESVVERAFAGAEPAPS